MSVVDAQTTLLSFGNERKTLAQSCLSKLKSLRVQKALLLSMVETGSNPDTLQTQQSVVDALQSDISNIKNLLKQLYSSKRTASSVILNTSPTPVVTVSQPPKSNLYDGPRGPTGPAGTTEHVSVDLVLTQGSSNAASSGAIYDAVQGVASGDVVSTVTSLPNNPVSGEIVYNTTTKNLCVYVNNAWKTMTLV